MTILAEFRNFFMRDEARAWRLCVGIGICFVLFACRMGASPAIEPSPTPRSFLTVDEVARNANTLQRQRITVRGRAEMIFLVTLLLCVPQTCDCNGSTATLNLVGESATIAIDDFQCLGNQCTTTCPVDPKWPAYEVTGTLVGVGRGMRLTNVDWDAFYGLADADALYDTEAIHLQKGRYLLPIGASPP
jgi:hypothetical protein